MKRQDATWLFGSIFLVVVVLFSYFLATTDRTVPKGRPDNRNLVSDQAPKDFLQKVIDDQKDISKYQSSDNQFTISLPSDLNVVTQENARADSNVSAAVFSRPNADTRETANRDTPNKYNPSVEDRLTVEAITHDQLSRLKDEVAFRGWYSRNISSRNIVNIQILDIDGGTTFFTQEQDGVGSTGQYLYFINERTVVTIGSADIPKSELLSIAGSFRFD